MNSNSEMTKWIAEIDDFIKSTSREEKARLWIQVKEMGLKGPSIVDFFSSLLIDKPLYLTFQEGIELCGIARPPEKAFEVTIKTPKFPLESFFYIFNIWKIQSLRFFNL